MKPTHDELAAQIAAFLDSGGQVERVESVQSQKMAEAHYYNATDRLISRKIRKKGKWSEHKKALMRSSRGI